MERRGFGQLIAAKRIEAGLTAQELAERLGRKSKSVVYDLEAEDQEPNAADINVLTATLSVSAEDLLRAMGVNLSAPRAAKLPRPLIDAILAIPPEQWPWLTDLVQRLATAGPLRGGTHQ